MELAEVFYSIQGEGTLTGEPMVFIRFQGCNQRCPWCDTKHSREPGKGWKDLTIDQIVDEVYLHGRGKVKWICITGGEPLLQKNLESLVFSLRSKGYYIEVETNGTLPIPSWFHEVDSWVPDCKCPSSKVIGGLETWFDMRPQDQIKFVVADQNDLNFTSRMLLKHSKSKIVKLVSPGFPNGYDLDWARKVAEFCKDTGARYSLQIHKVLWGNKLGV